MFCEVVEELGGVLLTGLLLGFLDLGFGYNGVFSCFGASFQPLEGESDVLILVSLFSFGRLSYALLSDLVGVLSSKSFYES